MSEMKPLDEPVVGEVDGGDKLKIFVDLYFWFSAYLIELYVSIAESLGLRERPLSSGSERVRWTCVCGCRLYDDFIELVPGAAQTLQKHLENSDPIFAQSTCSTDTSVPYDSNSGPAPDRFERAKDLGINSVGRRQTASDYDELRDRDLDILARHRTQAYTLWLPRFAYETTRRWENFHISAFDVFARKNSPDTELFLHIKERYCKTKGILDRFLSLQTVKTIWATDNNSPFHVLPAIGPKYLMHLWHNPHHTDWHTYQKNKSIFDTARWVMRKLLDLARTDNKCAGGIPENADDTLAGEQSRQNETEQHLFRQSYIFHTTPKELRLKDDPRARVDGSFLLLERFDFRRFLVLVAVFLWFIAYGLGLGVHFRYIAGLQGLKLHLRLFWISTWISGLSTLIITLQFRSSDHTHLESFWRFWQRDVWKYLEDNWQG